MRVRPSGPTPVRKRRGEAGADVSVYDDIAALIEDEQREIEGEKAQVDREHDRQIEDAETARAQAYAEAEAAYAAAVARAGAWYGAALEPLNVRANALNALSGQVVTLAEHAAQPIPDPTVPSSPEPTEDSSGSPTSAESSSAPEPPSSPSFPETDDSIPPTAPSPEASSATPIPAEEVDFVTVAPDQPVAVTLTTGEVKVVTAEDIMAAADADIPTDALTPDQAVIRNSDLP
jgi:hypothetical protein